MSGDINIVIIIELSNSLAFFITLFEYLRNLNNYIIVDSVSPFLLKEMLLKDIKEYIEKSESGQKEFNENIFEKVKKLFEK